MLGRGSPGRLGIRGEGKGADSPPSQLLKMSWSIVTGMQKKAMGRSLSAKEQVKMLVTVLVASLRVTT